MQIHIIQGDITCQSTEAIVNAANSSLLGGGGVDGAIHRAAGPQLLAECRTLNGCKTGEAKITNGYNLRAKYVIHTVGPIWYGGKNGEKDLLVSCYTKSIELALSHGLKSISFPLISSGAFGYPLKQAIKVAIDTLNKYANQIEIYLILFDYDTYSLSLEYIARK